VARTTYTSLNKEQQTVLNALIAYGHKVGASPAVILSAVSTGLVENGLKNTDNGSGTSVGWRQEISTKGTVAERLDLAKSIPKYYKEATAYAKAHPGATAGEIAQGAQGSAYPKRYSEHEDEAEFLKQEVLGAHEGHTPELFLPGLGFVGGEPESTEGSSGATGAFEKGAEGAEKAVESFSIGGFLEDLANPSTWLRVAEGIGGVILFFVGLKTLTKGTVGEGAVNQPAGAAAGAAKGTARKAAGGAAKVAKKAAEVAAAS
jgi:hypothetical protein